MRDAPISNATGGRLTSYYEFQARQVKRSEVALDVIDFEVVEESEPTIEVQEQQFDSWEDLMSHVKGTLGELE
jgi:hypothetical protein